MSSIVSKANLIATIGSFLDTWRNFNFCSITKTSKYEVILIRHFLSQKYWCFHVCPRKYMLWVLIKSGCIIQENKYFFSGYSSYLKRLLTGKWYILKGDNVFRKREKKILKCFLAWWQSRLMMRNHLNKLSITLRQEAPFEIWSSGYREQDV